MSKMISPTTPFEQQLRAKELEITKEIEEKLEKERKKSPYTKWTQVNNDKEAQAARYWLMKENPVAYCIMDFLASNMDTFNAIICSYKVIQEKFGYSKPTIMRAIKLLKEKQYVKIVKSGTSNVYLVNKTLYWNSWGTNYSYAEFGAKIIISSSEQNKLTQNEIEIEIKRRKEVIVKSN